MATIDIYDPPLCCASGVCGVDVDETLLYFAADLEWASKQGAVIQRHNLAQAPLDFASNPVVSAFLHTSGEAGLPLVLVDGQAVLNGRYPSRTELARWASLDAAPSAPGTSAGCSGSQCC